jgi:hypothetical protein
MNTAAIPALLRTLLAALCLLAATLPGQVSAAEPATAEPAAISTDDASVLDGLDLSEGVVQVAPEKSRWLTIGGPLLLAAFAVFILAFFKFTVPFTASTVSLNLHHYPTGVKRGLAMAVVFFGIAFAVGASELVYQLHQNGSAEEYFRQMSLGKLIVMTHAHLFGWTTSFLVVGVPFSMQFHHVRIYQWIFPLGLTAAITDVFTWWGIKFISPNFEYVSYGCGIVFSLSFLYMLGAILRVILLPNVILPTDEDAAERGEAIRKRNRLRELLRRDMQDIHPE